MTQNPSTNLERQIRSQPDELNRILASATVHGQIRVAVEGLHRARRIWLVGTGTSQHAGKMPAQSGRCAGHQRRPPGKIEICHDLFPLLRAILDPT